MGPEPTLPEEQRRAELLGAYENALAAARVKRITTRDLARKLEEAHAAHTAEMRLLSEANAEVRRLRDDLLALMPETAS